LEITIRVQRKFSSRVERARLEKIAQKTLRAEKKSASLALYVTDDAEMRAFNRDFHATDAPTDVLAFPASMRRDASAGRLYIGDIIISYDTAKRQARDARWRIADELDLLLVHGILHLLGYADVTPRQRARMWKRQTEILGRSIQLEHFCEL